jgi:hypothetical protein
VDCDPSYGTKVEQNGSKYRSRKVQVKVLRYYFDVDDGEDFTRDRDGVDLPDADEVRRMAVSLLPNLARDELPDGDKHVFSVKVRTEEGYCVYHATLSLIAEWLDHPGSGAEASSRRPGT